MSAPYSSLELDAISGNQYSADSEASNGTPIESIHSRTQDLLLESDSTRLSYKPIENNGQTTSIVALRGRRRKWRSIANHCNACCLVAGAIIALVIVPLVGLRSNYFGDELPSFGFCEPDGNFNTGLETVTVWSPSKAFQITLGFGSMSFSKAKFIDIMWDIAIGRGVQVILGFILYRVCTKCLARIMERSPVSFETFESVTLRDSSVWALFCLIKDYATNRGTRAKLALSWMILAMSYVLVFPTLMSAMTGYSATTQAYIQAPDGTQVAWSSFRLVNYIIYDGWRVGLNGSYLVSAVSREGSVQVNPSNYLDANICADYGYYYQGGFPPSDTPKGCLLTTAVSEYARMYGFYGRNHNSSTFSPDNSTIFNLTSPSLNISAFYIYPSGDLFGTAFGYNFISSGDDALFNNASLARFVRIDQPDNRTYDIPYLKDNGRCQQQNTYQWGFSFLLLFITLLLSALWALGMWGMWLDAYCNSKIDAAGERDMGSWRAVIDLAEGISSGLGSELPHSQDALGGMIAGTRNVGDKEIRRRVRRELGRGTIGYMVLVGPEKATITRSVRLGRWLQRRRWGVWLLKWRVWVIAGLILGILLITVVYPLTAFHV